MLAVGAVGAQSPELGKCSERPTAITGAYFADYLRWCVELVLDADDIEPLAFTALEAAPDGTLFATRPLAGQVVRITDSDGDELPDSMSVFADGLDLAQRLGLSPRGSLRLRRIQHLSYLRKWRGRDHRRRSAQRGRLSQRRTGCRA